MTNSPAVPRAQFADLDSALAALRAAGMRVTLARRVILQALFAAREPIPAEQIIERASSPEGPLDAASVYRNLEAFEHAGVVRHVHLGHGAGLYALVGEGEREYLYCERCGATRSLDPQQLDSVRALVRERFGHTARFTHFPIAGLCANCAKAAPDS
jgi:Fur family transcriptional regulator, ferric uptake regulator